eukprot:1255363-Amphidinium_carterae.1
MEAPSFMDLCMSNQKAVQAAESRQRVARNMQAMPMTCSVSSTTAPLLPTPRRGLDVRCPGEASQTSLHFAFSS